MVQTIARPKEDPSCHSMARSNFAAAGTVPPDNLGSLAQVVVAQIRCLVAEQRFAQPVAVPRSPESIQDQRFGHSLD